MEALLADWSPEFSVSLFRDYVLPGIGSGFVLSGLFWVAGYVVDFLIGLLKGGVR